MKTFDEKRKFGRRAVSMQATIEPLGRPAIACVVRNISEGGALLELIDRGAGIPHTFGLRLANSNVLIDCERTHVNGNTYGVAFRPQDGIAGAAARRAIRNVQEAMSQA